MKLSIITINYNNATGLRKTMENVFAQTSMDFEYIVVDGGSTDSSCQVISEQLGVTIDKRLVINDKLIKKEGEAEVNGIPVRWISEKDDGIYHAMNKGIGMAQGEYVQFLNSGDVLATVDVTKRMLFELKQQAVSSKRQIEILYGNMLKPYKGKILCDKGFAGRQPNMLDFYTGSLNHSPAYIQRTLFEKFGPYDESLKIVSDWKWYLQVIALNNVMPVYTDMDVTVFDMTGISNTNSTLDKAERRKVLEELLPLSVLRAFDEFSGTIDQSKRLNRYWLTRRSAWLAERVLFKWEKWFRNKEQVF
ncbi:MAG: glycosyltransferase [Paludibacteraceae bacterium]